MTERWTSKNSTGTFVALIDLDDVSSRKTEMGCVRTEEPFIKEWEWAYSHVCSPETHSRGANPVPIGTS